MNSKSRNTRRVVRYTRPAAPAATIRAIHKVANATRGK